MRVRKPIASGSFYDENPKLLQQQIENAFTDELGPGALPIKKRAGFIYGAIVPHAGYAYSGPCAAWAYKELGEAEPAETYVILGPNHTGMGTSGVSTQAFSTPFGVVRSDKKLADYLVNKGSIKNDELPHMQEHSIEVQLPFLQFINRDVESWKILPVVLSDDVDYKQFATDLKEAVIDLDKKITVIASSDFTHYGHAYGYIPFSLDVPNKLKELDMGAVEFIKKKDDVGFLNYVDNTGATICGSIPIATLLRLMNNRRAELLQYYRSGDLVGNYKNSVSYASIIFR